MGQREQAAVALQDAYQEGEPLPVCLWSVDDLPERIDTACYCSSIINQGMSSSLFVADQARAPIIERMAGLERLEQSGANVVHGEKSGILIKHLFVLQERGMALGEIEQHIGTTPFLNSITHSSIQYATCASILGSG